MTCGKLTQHARKSLRHSRWICACIPDTNTEHDVVEVQSPAEPDPRVTGKNFSTTITKAGKLKDATFDQLKPLCEVKKFLPPLCSVMKLL